MKTFINALIIILILHFVIKNFEDEEVSGYDPNFEDYGQEDFEDVRLQYLIDEVYVYTKILYCTKIYCYFGTIVV